MSIKEKLKDLDLKLSKSDQALLDYFRREGLKACRAPISQIAQSCGISHATVTRLAHKLGYDNLRSFKIALASELSSEDDPLSKELEALRPDESFEESARKLNLMSLNLIREQKDKLNFEALKALVQAMLTAPQVCVVGLNLRAPLALWCEQRFLKCQINATSITQSSTLLLKGPLFSRKDLLLIIDPASAQEELFIKNALRVSEPKVAVITSVQGCRLSPISFAILQMADGSLRVGSGAFDLHLQLVFLIDLIAAQLLKAHSQNTNFVPI